MAAVSAFGPRVPSRRNSAHARRKRMIKTEVGRAANFWGTLASLICHSLLKSDPLTLDLCAAI